MVVGFEPATPSNLLIYVPRTNSIVSRGQFTPINDLTQFKVIMAERSKGAIFSDDCIHSLSESSPTDDVIDTAVDPDDYDAVVNSLPLPFSYYAAVANSLPLSSAFPVYNLSDLNRQMKADPAIDLFGQAEVTKGCLKEIDNLTTKYGVTKWVKSNQVPLGATVLTSSDIFKGKTKNGILTEVKVRIAAHGNRQREDSYGQTSSPTVDSTSVNILLSLAKFYKATLSTADVPAAYLHSDLDEEIYMRFSKKMSAIIVSARPELAVYLDDKGHLLCQLLKSLYGLKQAGANWSNELLTTILSARFI